MVKLTFELEEDALSDRRVNAVLGHADVIPLVALLHRVDDESSIAIDPVPRGGLDHSPVPTPGEARLGVACALTAQGGVLAGAHADQASPREESHGLWSMGERGGSRDYKRPCYQHISG